MKREIATDGINDNDTVVSPWLGPGAFVAVLLVFASIVAWVSFSVRNDIRSQLMARDAYALGQMLETRVAEAESELVFDFESLDEESLWISLLDAANMKGVFAAQLFSLKGELLHSTPEDIVLEEVPDKVLAELREGNPYTEFHESVALGEMIRTFGSDDRALSVLSVFVPVRASLGSEQLALARFLTDGETLKTEFGLLDHRIARQASIAIGGGSILMLGLFGLAWRRLELANRHVLRQAKRLTRTNAELAMLARTSAVGSVAAHLIHGLKNPLAGLKQVVAAQSHGDATLDSEDWIGASEAANRMQRMVQEVVDLLQDSSSGAGYDMNLSEIKDEIESRFATRAADDGVDFECEIAGNAVLASHVSNIVVLIVSNLTQNALDAVSLSDEVRLSFGADENDLIIDVSDTGPGIDEAQRENLFSPVQSRKEGGAGIGLAISMQMARYIGATLQCLKTEGKGASFELRLPLKGEGIEDEGN